MPRRIKVLHELLDVFLVNPCRAEAHFYFRGVEVFGLRLFQRRHVDLEQGVLLRCPFCLAELLPDVAREVLVGCLPALRPICPACFKVEWAGTGRFVDNAMQVLHNCGIFLLPAQ